MTEAILPEGVTLYRLTKDRAVDLWENLKTYDALWPDNTRGDLVGWVDFCLKPSTLFIEETGGRAMYILSDIREGLKARIHAVFHDHKLRHRVDTMRKLLVWAMFEFDLYRLEARIPETSHALRRLLQHDLGFRYEGLNRDDHWFGGHLASTVMLSILRDEVG